MRRPWAPAFTLLVLIFSARIWAQNEGPEIELFDSPDTHQDRVQDEVPDWTGSFIQPLSNKGIVLNVCGDGIHASGELCFDPPVLATNTGTNPNWVETGYINGGGNLDFVACHSSNNNIRIKLGSGNGSFGGTYTYTMGNSPLCVKLADFNDDGLTDIIATRFPDDKIRIRWGHTNWASFSNYGTGVGPVTVDVGDLNNDGLDDFVTANTSATITVRLRQAGGGFTYQNYPGGILGYFVQLIDCNNDGLPDVAYPDAAGDTSKLIVRLNFGSQLGGPIVINTGNSMGLITGITHGDYNNDGNQDIIAIRDDQTAVRVLGNGNATFQAPSNANLSQQPCRIRSFDFDNDGNLDFIIGNEGTSIDIFRGLGNGNFDAPRNFGASIGVTGVCDINAGDFNNDGSLDIVYTGNEGVYLMLANP